MVYVLIATILGILLLTVFPLFAAIMRGFGPYTDRLARSVLSGPGIADSFGNFVIFVPFGFAAMRIAMKGTPLLAVGHVVAITSLGALLSFMIEGAQMLLPRRTPSLYDIAFNTLGTFVGVALGLWWHRMLERTRGRAPTAE